MGPPQRVRYNSKARGSTAGSSSHKKRARSPDRATEPTAAIPEDGLDIVVRKTKEEIEESRRKKLKEELIAASGTGISAKRKKRIDALVTKRLKKDDRNDLMNRLQASQASLPTSLLPSLASAATLGSRHLSSHSERMAKAEDLSVRKLLSKKRKLNDHSGSSGSSGEEDGDEEDDWEAKFGGDAGAPLQRYIAEPEPEVEMNEPAEREQKGRATSGIDGVMAVEESVQKPKVDLASIVVGGALRKKEPGETIKVVPLKKGKGKGKMMTFGAWKSAGKQAGPPSDSSFDSSDSEMDSGSDAESGDMSDMSDGMDMSSKHGSSQEDDEDEEDDSDGSEEMEEAQGSEQEPKKKWSDWGHAQHALTYKQVDESPIDPSYTKPAYEEGLNLVAGSTSKPTSDANPTPTPKPARPIPTQKIGPLGETLRIPTSSLLIRSSNPKNRQIVNRDEELQKKRLELPVVADEQDIMEKILISNVVVLCGETGSGKTTQVPQFLYEAGFGSPGSDNPGMVAVTQPRRVAAMSMASRVASELALPSSKVSYQIRYDATTSPETAIKFMTDGVLLREIARDLLLMKYSVVIVDEAHERSVNTDVLIGLLSRIVQLRKKRFDDAPEGAKPPPLRLVIMSATLRVTDFTLNTRLFKTPPPTITIPTRQHPVTVHFNRRTPSDYLTEAYKKVSKIHTRLPPGGVLVFLTGQGEIQTLVKNLEKRYGVKAWEERKRLREKANLKAKEMKNWWKEDKKKGKEDEPKEKDMKLAANNADTEIEDMDFAQDQTEDLAGDVDDGADSDPEALDSDSDSDDEIILNEAESEVPMYILPLYSLLPSDKQMKVFAEPPAGTRLVVVATNVAETSLTIPGIRYVVDCGRAKERHFDPVSGVQAFKVSWISKASASQRAGRAGRTGPGHCYRLYSSPVFENYFEQFAEPEILRMPIEGIVLQMKSMNISAVVNFPFPTPPNRESLAKAEKILTLLGALEAPSKEKEFAAITPLGHALSLFPVSPRFSKMLVSGQSHGCLPYVIAAVAVLAVGDPFLREAALGGDEDEEEEEENALADAPAELAFIRNTDIRQKEERRLKRKSFFQTQAIYNALGNGASDVFRMLAVVGAYEYDGTGERFCAKNFIRPKAMQEIHKLRAQISHIAQANLPSATPSSSAQPLFSPKLAPPNNTQLKVLRQLLTSAFIDQVAVRKDILDPSSRSAGAKFESTRGVAYRAMGVDEDVYIHPSSVLFHGEPPEWVVWQDVVRTSKVYIKTVTKLNPAWLPSLSPSQFISYSKPLETPKSVSQAKLIGSKEGETRDTFVIPRFHMSALASGAGLDSKGVELPPMKRVEVWKGGRWTMQQTIRHHIHHPPPIAPDLPNRPPTSSWDTLQYTFTPRPSPEQPPNPPPSLQSPSPSARPTSPPAHSSFHTSLNRPTPSPGSVIGGTFEESDKDARAGPRGSPLAIVHRSEDSRLDLSVECRKVLDLSWEREGQGGSRKGLFPLSSKEGNEPTLVPSGQALDISYVSIPLPTNYQTYPVQEATFDQTPSAGLFLHPRSPSVFYPDITSASFLHRDSVAIEDTSTRDERNQTFSVDLVPHSLKRTLDDIDHTGRRADSVQQRASQDEGSILETTSFSFTVEENARTGGSTRGRQSGRPSEGGGLGKFVSFALSPMEETEKSLRSMTTDQRTERKPATGSSSTLLLPPSFRTASKARSQDGMGSYMDDSEFSSHSSFLPTQPDTQHPSSSHLPPSLASSSTHTHPYINPSLLASLPTFGHPLHQPKANFLVVVTSLELKSFTGREGRSWLLGEIELFDGRNVGKLVVWEQAAREWCDGLAIRKGDVVLFERILIQPPKPSSPLQTLKADVDNLSKASASAYTIYYRCSQPLPQESRREWEALRADLQWRKSDTGLGIVGRLKDWVESTEF